MILGQYDYCGRVKPGGPKEGFSVGIFQWVTRKIVICGHTLRRGTIIYRVRGFKDQPDVVYKRAIEICRGLNSGVSVEYLYGPAKRKSEAVGRRK